MTGPYVGKWTAGTGEMDGECTSTIHFYQRQVPRATFYDKGQNRWVCFTCAQQRNRELFHMKIDTRKAGCISGRDYMLEVLMR